MIDNFWCADCLTDIGRTVSHRHPASTIFEGTALCGWHLMKRVHPEHLENE